MKIFFKIFLGVVIAGAILSFFLSHNLSIKKKFNTSFQFFNLAFTENNKNVYVTLVKIKIRNDSYLKSTLKSAGRAMVIYLHHAADHISQSIIKSGTWEAHLVKQFEDYIIANPGIQVLDAGCNVGVYTLTAAALGARVVAVDANINNTNRLSQSLLANKLENNVSLCLNALSNQRKDFFLSKDLNNVGGQYVIENKNRSDVVKGIIMDDLLILFEKDRPIMIKIDIQGKEIESFQNATRLFNERNVKLVMIEWDWIKNMPGIEGLIQFFDERNYTPYVEYKKIHKLNIKLYKSWPYDIVWIKE